MTRGHEGVVCLPGLGRGWVVLLAVLDDDGEDGKGGEGESEEQPGIWTLSREHTNPGQWISPTNYLQLSTSSKLQPPTMQSTSSPSAATTQ